MSDSVKRKGKPCSVCSRSDLADINRAIVKGAGTFRSVAERFNTSHTTVRRHHDVCLGRNPKRESKTPPAKRVADALARVSAGESERNGSNLASLEPKSLVAATSRLVDEALDLLEHAKKADDRRLALAALREARDGLALLMKAAGMLSNDTNVNINVDARKQGMALVAGLTSDDLRALVASARGADKSTLTALEPVTYEALPAEGS